MSGSVSASRELLASLADASDCRFDHHGGCQEHGYLDLQPGEKCPQAELKELLAPPDPRPSAAKVAVCEYLLAVNERDPEHPFIAPTAIDWLGNGIVSALREAGLFLGHRNEAEK